VALLLCDKAWWNDEMDKAAKKHWDKIQISPDPQINSLLREPWELWLDNEKSEHGSKKLIIRTHMWPNYPELLVEQNKIQRHGYRINRLGGNPNSGDWHDDQTTPLGNKICHRILCHQAK